MLKKKGGVQRLRKTQSNVSAASHPKTTHTQRPVTKKQPDYEKLGKMLFAIGESGTSSRKKLYRIAFWKGMWGGLGGVIGATIIVSLLLWLFNVLGSVPLVGPFIDIVEQSVPSNQAE